MVDTGDTRRTIHDGRRTTPGVWHKLSTGELKIDLFIYVTAFFFRKPMIECTLYYIRCKFEMCTSDWRLTINNY